MQNKSAFFRLFTLALLIVLVVPLVPAVAQDETPPAEIVNDEGGPVAITGSVEYTNAFFTDGVAQPLVILEDQAGFVDRNEYYLMSMASQTMGQITSDFFTSPFTYSLALPIEPQGDARDVDNDGEEDAGVMVFAVAYWTNTFGDPFLEERDLYGGGWSTAYASTRIDPSAEAEREVIGGKYVVYATDDQQGFPAGFGEDGLLFTEDDPIVLLPQGYTVVDMDTAPFIFERSRYPVIDLIEGEASEADDFSEMSYTEAFDAMIEKFRKEYAFTEFKGLDWDAISAEFRPRFEEAEANADIAAYEEAIFDFTLAIPDGHIGSGVFPVEKFFYETDGGLGMAIRDVDDGSVIVSFILEGGPAAEAGIVLGAEIVTLNDVPIGEAVGANNPWSGPFSATHNRRLQQLRYAIRFPLDTEVEVSYKNPGDDEATSVTLTTIAERDSHAFSSINVGLSGYELPVEFEMLDSGYGYVKIYDFLDNQVLTIQLWERMIREFNENGVPGIIIDMRQNGGGSGFLADQMAAYFFDEALELGSSGIYDEDLDDFYFDERYVDVFYPPAEDMRYYGALAVLVGPPCMSACEFFSYDMTMQDRAAIVGQYPTAGLGGGVEQFFMPEGHVVQLTIGRAVDAEGNIHIEGTGVVPTILVPVTAETLLVDESVDVVLDAAVAYLDGATGVEILDGGAIAVGDVLEGELVPGVRVHYVFETGDGGVFDILLSDEAGIFDTVLRIYDTDGNLLAENDDLNDETYNSGFEALEIPGDMTLVLEAATYEDTGAGAFTLEIAAVEAE